MLTYTQRATHCKNPLAARLFKLLDTKKTNLSVAVDVTRKADLLALADLMGPFIAVLKTHIDILEDFDPSVIVELKRLAKKHDFLIFEDRKFADIGNTVSLQYEKGIYRIADWADITNAHPVPGPGIIEGLKQVGLPRGRGLLILAEMSSKGNLAVGDYRQAGLEMAEAHDDFVIGFIAQQKLLKAPHWIYLTPGVKLGGGGDALKQNYVTPHQAIVENGTDIIIVGRGIYEVSNPLAEAEKYRAAGWEAYQQTLKL